MSVFTPVLLINHDVLLLFLLLLLFFSVTSNGKFVSYINHDVAVMTYLSHHLQHVDFNRQENVASQTDTICDIPAEFESRVTRCTFELCLLYCSRKVVSFE